jgi:hypothetical protein
MKAAPVFITLLAIACLAISGASDLIHEQSSGVFSDFAAFKAARMQLPEKYIAHDSAATEITDLSCQGQKPFPEYKLMQKLQSDLNKDGVYEEYLLQDGRVTVRIGPETAWQSPDEWWIDYFFTGDATNDGSLELNLLVWKEGSFGPHKPFWVEAEDHKIKNHLFIFKLEGNSLKPVWQSSNLDNPNYWATLADVNNDNANELVVIEGSYTDPLRRQVTVWQWNGWGFTRIN